MMIRDETQPRAMPASSRVRQCTVRIEAEGRVYVGRIHVPDNRRRVSDVLADDRAFLNMTDVSVDGSEQIEPFVALAKRYVRTVRIVEEGEEMSAATTLGRR